MDWLKKADDMVLQSWMYDCLKMYEIFDEVIKFIKIFYGKLESRIDSGRKKPDSGEDPERYLVGRSAITITIFNSDDTTQSLT